MNSQRVSQLLQSWRNGGQQPTLEGWKFYYSSNLNGPHYSAHYGDEGNKTQPYWVPVLSVGSDGQVVEGGFTRQPEGFCAYCGAEMLKNSWECPSCGGV